jgi:hypothetical protein
MKRRDFRNGSISSIRVRGDIVRLTPRSGPFLYSITSSAMASSPGGTSMPSTLRRQTWVSQTDAKWLYG